MVKSGRGGIILSGMLFFNIDLDLVRVDGKITVVSYCTGQCGKKKMLEFAKKISNWSGDSLSVRTLNIYTITLNIQPELQ